MKTFLISTITVFIILLTCCSPKVKNGNEESIKSSSLVFPIKIDMEKFVHTQFQEINLSMVADSLEYIPLETCAGSLIKNIEQTILTDSFIFINTDDHVLKFRRDGKFLSQIGTNGRGPGEYPGVRSVSIDNAKNQVFIYPNYIRKIIHYSYNNKFSGNTPLFRSDLASDVSFIGNNHFIASGVFTIPGEMSSEMFQVAITDSTGKIKIKVNSPLSQFADYLTKKDIYYPGSFLPSYFDTIVLSIGFGCDTIYEVNQQAIEPRYILSSGKYNAPADIKYGFSRDMGVRTRISEQKYKYIWLNNSPIETKEFLFLSFSLEDHMYLAAYNKLEDTASVFRKKGDVKYGMIRAVDDFGLKNDLDGGLPFYPKWTNFRNNVWITSYNSIELKNKLANIQESDDPKYSKKQKSLIQLKDKLNENDNPVLVIAHLK